jgi:hypothetical protein
VNFVVGKSDPHRDWFFQHVPHNEDPAAKSIPFRGTLILTIPAGPVNNGVIYDCLRLELDESLPE